MILKRLKLQNIRSYKQAEINFPTGSTLLMGDIGSGKTSVLLAIEFALFGLQPSQRGNSLLRNNEDEAFVSLEIEIEEKSIIIERKLKRGSKGISQGDASIIIDGTRIDGGVTEIKNKVLEILNYPQEFAKKTNDLYKFTVYTPQEEMKQIILESDEARLNTLRHVFGIEKYKRMSENLSLLATKLRQEIRLKEVQSSDIGKKDLRLQGKIQLLREQEGKIKELDLEVQKVRAKKQEKQQEIQQLEEKINERKRLETEKARSETLLSSKKDLMKGHEGEISALKTQIEEGKKFTFKEEDITYIRSRISAQEEILRSVNEDFIEVVSSIQGAESKKREIDALKIKISGISECPTCLQSVSHDYKSNILTNADNEIQILNERLAGSNKRKSELSEKIEQVRKQIEALKNSLSETEILKVKIQGLKEKEQRADEMGAKKAALHNEIEAVSRQLSELTTLITDFNKYTEAYEARNKELHNISQEENQVLIRQAEVKKEIQFLQAQILELNKEIADIKKILAQLSHIRELEYWLTNKFSQLISFTERNVMLKLRGEFSELFSRWFAVLVSDTLTVHLDESFTPIIQQQDYELDYEYLSGGERTAVALAYRLALNQVINSLLSTIKTHDLVILDEPTDGFSDQQLDKIRDVLQQLDVKQLILVSHEPKIESFVENIIKFQKTDGVTRVET